MKFLSKSVRVNYHHFHTVYLLTNCIPLIIHNSVLPYLQNTFLVRLKPVNLSDFFHKFARQLPSILVEVAEIQWGAN